jgi:hypothetical protein
MLAILLVPELEVESTSANLIVSVRISMHIGEW